jgi:hypothetical protein
MQGRSWRARRELAVATEASARVAMKDFMVGLLVWVGFRVFESVLRGRA